MDLNPFVHFEWDERHLNSVVLRLTVYSTHRFGAAKYNVMKKKNKKDNAVEALAQMQV